jgi:hypothetical protein
MSVKETRRSAIKHWPTAGALENSSQRQKSRWPMVVATVREGECHGTHTKIVQRGVHAEMHTLIDILILIVAYRNKTHKDVQNLQ